MTVKFHDANSEHIADLIRLNDCIQKQHADGDPEHFRYPLDTEKVRRFFSRVLEAEDNRIFLAFVDGIAVGYVWFEHGNSYENPFTFRKKQILVHHIFVQEENRHDGIASGFFDVVLAEAKSHKSEEVILNTYLENEGAQAFFKSHGFKTTKLTMRKTL
ncbi:MAG: GNAT family N-acetyltransferase [Sneathiella sp.]